MALITPTEQAAGLLLPFLEPTAHAQIAGAPGLIAMQWNENSSTVTQVSHWVTAPLALIEEGARGHTFSLVKYMYIQFIYKKQREM